MFFAAGRRLFTLVVVTFACLGFMTVPVGTKTGYEHVKTVLATPEAERVAESLGVWANRLRASLATRVGDIGAVKEQPHD